MEKQRIKSISKSCRRLLIFFVYISIFSNNISSQVLTINEINQLKIVPAAEQQLYTQTDIKFEVVIPRVKPSQVQVQSSSQIANVIFKTIRKQEDFENNGTRIELWYNFEKKGTYQLPPLPVIIQNRRRSIKFSSVTINDDPSKQSPQMVAVFSNGTRLSSADDKKSKPLFNSKTGQKQTLTVYVQYISQVVQFSWDIPKDSIFTQTKTYDITEIKYREKNYTHSLIPVATFEWTGLKSGVQPMVKLKLVVTDYNGYRTELFLPESYINFTESTVSSNTQEDLMFNEAFYQSKNVIDSKSSTQITEEDCIKLAELYSAERNTIFHFSQNYKNRTSFENSLGLPSTTPADFTMGYLHISVAISLILLILLILAIRKKKLLLDLFLASLFICSLIPLVNLCIKRNDIYAVCKGTTIHSVPEDKSEAISEIGAGNRVHVTEKAGRWIYIEFGETGGWGLKDNVIFIK